MPDETKVFQIFLLSLELQDHRPLSNKAIEACAKEAIRKAQIFEQVYRSELENDLGLPTPKKRG